MDSNERPQNSVFFALLLLVGAALIFLYARRSDVSPEKNYQVESAGSEYNAGTVQDRVNRNLLETSNKIEDMQLRAKLVSPKINTNARDMAPFTVKEEKKPLPLEPGSGQERPKVVETATPTDGSRTIDYTTPRRVIEMELADKQAEALAQEAYRREYIRQFVENAKKDGWKVDVDSKGNVKNVVPIKKPAYNLFKPTAESSE